ncbi:MAG: enamine deaminase RidA (YjgF/YER057c/UK114 family) [Planctomycetota bacterium]|jgi:enamine deaminase RidA (YjgF/YER057c/UK114 family)
MSSRKNISSGSPYEPRFGFSRAVRVLVAGTGPTWPDGSCPDDPAVQTRRCIEIMEEALIEAGASLKDVVRGTVFWITARSGRRRPWWWRGAYSIHAGASRWKRKR